MRDKLGHDDVVPGGQVYSSRRHCDRPSGKPRFDGLIAPAAEQMPYLIDIYGGLSTSRTSAPGSFEHSDLDNPDDDRVLRLSPPFRNFSSTSSQSP